MLLRAKTRIPRPGGAVFTGELFEVSDMRAAHYKTIGWAEDAPVQAAAPPAQAAAEGAAAAPVAAPVAELPPKAKAPKKRRKPLKVGELVNVEIGGALQLAAPEPVAKISRLGGETWVHVGDSKSAVLLEQIVRQ
jgi:hypothetical protein